MEEHLAVMHEKLRHEVSSPSGMGKNMEEVSQLKSWQHWAGVELCREVASWGNGCPSVGMKDS